MERENEMEMKTRIEEMKKKNKRLNIKTRTNWMMKLIDKIKKMSEQFQCNM